MDISSPVVYFPSDERLCIKVNSGTFVPDVERPRDPRAPKMSVTLHLQFGFFQRTEGHSVQEGGEGEGGELEYVANQDSRRRVPGDYRSVLTTR